MATLIRRLQEEEKAKGANAEELEEEEEEEEIFPSLVSLCKEEGGLCERLHIAQANG